jgi:hypothetical protein
VGRVSIADKLKQVEEDRLTLKQAAAKIDIEQKREKERLLQLLSDKLDLSTREAFNAGAKKAWLKRAWGTKASVTVDASLARTEHLEDSGFTDEEVGNAEFAWDEELRELTVNGENEQAVFEIQMWDEELVLAAITLLYSGENLEDRNELVLELDALRFADAKTDLQKRAVQFVQEKIA